MKRTIVPHPAARISFAAIAAALALPASAQNPGFYTKNDVRIDQRLQAQLPLDASFTDETGQAVTLGSYFGKRPVLLNMIFYRCQGACALECNGLVSIFKQMSMSPGKEFEVVTVSIDPKEGPDLAAAKKATYMEMLGRPEMATGWHFLVGPQSSIDRLAEAVGFHYKYNAKDNTFAHSAALMVCTPEGKLSRYFYGAHYSQRDVALAAVEASAGRIGSPAQEIVLLLCHFDPLTGKYSLAVMKLLQVFGTATILVMAGCFVVLSRKAGNKRAAPSVPSPTA